MVIAYLLLHCNLFAVDVDSLNVRPCIDNGIPMVFSTQQQALQVYDRFTPQQKDSATLWVGAKVDINSRYSVTPSTADLFNVLQSTK